MKLLVSVTKEDIKKGDKKCAASCPIARSVKRIRGVSDISVGSEVVRFSLGGKRFSFENNSLTRDFIREFDTGYGVSPFSTKLEESRDL